MNRAITKADEQCGACWTRPKFLRRFADIRIFVALMCAVIAVQGAYLGYIVGVLTNIERRFELSSSRSGSILSMYDIGHTATVLFVGHFLSRRHKPRWTAIGVLLSAVSMFALTLPHLIFGGTAYETLNDDGTVAEKMKYGSAHGCRSRRPHFPSIFNKKEDSSPENACANQAAHEGAYAILCLAQLLAGVAAAPFNTVAYIYIDDNVDSRQSPFYLGLLTSMYAFGPAFGFALSSWCNSMYVNLRRPRELDPTSPNWIGAWWLGFIICGVLYLLLVVPLYMFPMRMKNKTRLEEQLEMTHMMQQQRDSMAVHGENASEAHRNACRSVLDTVKDLPLAAWTLLKNPIYSVMVAAWIFGSYLVGGYATYLPKYLETQYHQAAWAADLYAGLISIGSVAVSTAVGGYLLARFNISSRRSLVYLMITWSVIAATYLIGMIVGCVQPSIQGQHLERGRWNFTTSCNAHCDCDRVIQFDPVCDMNVTYFSPCHAGCTYDYHEDMWHNCKCTKTGSITRGSCNSGCAALPLYISIMFIGFFIGNLFFMTTMMVVLRCVQDEQRSLALSFASFLTNVLGFIPSPILFGHIIDTTCIVWHSICPDSGNCILYDNKSLRYKYHIGNAGFQIAAIAATFLTWLISKKYKFPEEIHYDDDVDEQPGPDQQTASSLPSNGARSMQ